MSRIEPKCRECRTNMEEGFILDLGHHSSRTTAKWVEGEPQKSFWKGLALKDRQVLQITAFRCPQCGRLEQYAIEKAESVS